MRRNSVFSVSCLLILSSFLFSCSGGGGGSGGATTPVPTPISVAISPQVAYVLEGGQKSFNANVSGSSNTDVTWSLQEGSAGGTIISGNYTASNVPGTYHVIATSVADPTKFSVALVSVPHYSRFLFLANQNDGTVSAYTVNSATGQIRASGYVFTGSQANPSSITVDPSNKYVYMANRGLNSIASFIITSSGSLTYNGNPVNTGSNSSPSSLIMSPNGQSVYVANSGSNTISSFNIANDGTLTPGGSIVSGLPYAITIDPFGKYLYQVDNASSGTISAFKVGSGGTLTSIGAIPAGTKPSALTVDPSGKYIYVANNTASGTISAFNIGSGGGLTPINSISAGTNPTSVAVDPSGRYLYVSNFGDNTVSSYSINPNTGALTPIATTNPQSGTNPGAIGIDPQDNFVYVANNGSNDVYAYKIQLDGSLSYASLMRARSGPGALILSQGMDPVSYVPEFLYTANNGSISGLNGISTFLIDPPTGYLTSSSPGVDTGSQPYSVTTDLSGQFLYVSDFSSNDVWSFSIDPVLGTLSSIGSPVLSNTNPVSIAVDPSGRFVYAACSGTGVTSLSFYDILSDGSLTNDMGSIPNVAFPFSIAIDPTGQFAYVVNSHSGNVNTMRVNPNDGTLSVTTGNPVYIGTTLTSVTTDPTGQFAFVTGGDYIYAFLISSSDGSLTAIGTPQISQSGSAPSSIAVEPTGKYLYAANNGSGTVSPFSIATDGSLTYMNFDAQAGGSAAQKAAFITVDSSGTYVYVANSSDSNIYSFIINSDGTLLTDAVDLAGVNATPMSLVTTGFIQ
ncbi:MAG: lactonase family protein [Nitrospiria bacterium]